MHVLSKLSDHLSLAALLDAWRRIDDDPPLLCADDCGCELPGVASTYHSPVA